MNSVPKVEGALSSWAGQIGTNEIFLFVTGIGPRNAEICARAALGLDDPVHPAQNGQARRPDAVLIIGLCGSLDAAIGESTTVSYSDCLCTDKNLPPISCSPSLTGQIINLLNSRNIECRPVVGISSSRVATLKAEKLQLGARGANVVDMESYPILSAANLAQLPAAVVRVVSDSLDREMPDFNRALRTDGEIDPLRVAGIILGSPITTLKFLSASRNSTQRLKEVLELILPRNFSGSGSL